MTLEVDLLVDSDAFVGLFYEKDGHHSTVKHLFSKIEKQRLQLATTNYVVLEVATLLSNRKGQDSARLFLRYADHYPTIHITKTLHEQALFLFKSQQKKGTSVVDCANVIAARTFSIPYIFSFDKFYPRKCGLSLFSS